MKASRRLAHKVFGRSARVRFDRRVWAEMIAELGRRGGGRREAGAFLLAPREGATRLIAQVVYLDDLDPTCLVGGIHFHGEGYSKLWSLCDRLEMRVIADIHTHPGSWVGQSPIDAENPMVSKRGHIGLIAPHLARKPVAPVEVGVHEYRGEEGWASSYGRNAKRLLYVGRFA
jgi:hypothetical protein